MARWIREIFQQWGVLIVGFAVIAALIGIAAMFQSVPEPPPPAAVATARQDDKPKPAASHARVAPPVTENKQVSDTKPKVAAAPTAPTDQTAAPAPAPQP